MRMIRILFACSALLCLALAPSVLADEAPNPFALDPIVVSETLEPAPAPMIDLGPMADLLGTDWTGPAPVGYFGSHCSGPPSPWTCGHTEGGLGCPPGGYCTYSCQCDECVMSDGRVVTVAINCTLVDDGGCLACPM